MARNRNKGRAPSQIFIPIKMVSGFSRDGEKGTYPEAKTKIKIAKGYGVTLDLSNLVTDEDIKKGGIWIKFWANYPRDYVPSPAPWGPYSDIKTRKTYYSGR